MFGPKRLPSILKGFHKTINDLTKLRESNTKKIDANSDRMARVMMQSADLRQESDAATRIQDKIFELIS